MRTLAILTLLVGGCTRPSGQQLTFSPAEYRTLDRVDDVVRVAPTDCRAPIDRPLASASRDESTHGRKYYHLFAKDRTAYLRAKDVDQPDGQVLVKESWLDPQRKTKSALFLMVKTRGEWTYATATPDGSTVTAAGRLTACIDCHESPRTRDRMFGLTSSAAAD